MLVAGKQLVELLLVRLRDRAVQVEIGAERRLRRQPMIGDGEFSQVDFDDGGCRACAVILVCLGVCLGLLGYLLDLGRHLAGAGEPEVGEQAFGCHDAPHEAGNQEAREDGVARFGLGGIWFGVGHGKATRLRGAAVGRRPHRA